MLLNEETFHEILDGCNLLKHFMNF
jgi:hypothetical protein